MMTREFSIRVSVSEAVSRLTREPILRLAGAELEDRMEQTTPAGRCVILVFRRQKRSLSGPLTMTLSVDDFTGVTRIKELSGAQRKRPDFGAADAFADFPARALSDVICRTEIVNP